MVGSKKSYCQGGPKNVDEAEVNKLFLSTNNYPQPFLLKSLRQSDFLSILSSSYLLPQKMASHVQQAQQYKQKWQADAHNELCQLYGENYIVTHSISHNEQDPEFPYHCMLCSKKMKDIHFLKNHLETRKHKNKFYWKHGNKHSAETSADDDSAVVQHMYESIQEMTNENKVKLLRRLYKNNSEEYKKVIKTSEAEAWLTTTHQSKDIEV